MDYTLSPTNAAKLILATLEQPQEQKAISAWYRRIIMASKEGVLTCNKLGRQYFFDQDEIKCYAEEQKLHTEKINSTIKYIQRENVPNYQNEVSMKNNNGMISKRLLLELIRAHQKTGVNAEDTLSIINTILNCEGEIK